MPVRLRYIIALAVAAIIVAADQLSKLWVEEAFDLWSGVTVIDGLFNLVRVHNSGAVFGILADQRAIWPRFLFIGATIVAVLLILHLLRSNMAAHRSVILALGFILGGAVGNLLDRARLGVVVDFLDFHIRTYHWPAFNIADIAICLGALFLLISTYKSGRKKIKESRRHAL